MKQFALLLLRVSLVAWATPLSAQSDQQQSTQPDQPQATQSSPQQATTSNQQQGAQPNQKPKPAMHFERGFGAGSNVVNSATGVAGGGRNN